MNRKSVSSAFIPIAMIAGAALAALSQAEARVVVRPAALADRSGAVFRLADTTPTANRSSAAEQLSQEERRFLVEATQSGIAEIAVARLAESRAQNQQLRDIARQLIRDHEQANERLSAIASAYSIMLPSKPKAEGAKLADSLQKLSGEQFDRMYLPQSIDAHRRSIGLFEKTANGSKNDRIRSFANETLPTLRKHLEMLQNVK